MGKWKPTELPESAWRCSQGASAAQRTAEQDLAAGGREYRAIETSDGTALASVALRRKRDGRRVYAYLRWSERGRTKESYLGEVDQTTRAANLSQAWLRVRAPGIAQAPTLIEANSTAKVSAKRRSWASSPAVRAVMRGNKSRDTRPELAVRSAAHALGLRYRVGVSPLPGLRRTADLVFSRAKVAVFVDGCFWHGCPEHHRPARRNSEFWTAKINGNITRDADTDLRLRDAGWRVIRIWEHESPGHAASKIEAIVHGTASCSLAAK